MTRVFRKIRRLVVSYSSKGGGWITT